MGGPRVFSGVPWWQVAAKFPAISRLTHRATAYAQITLSVLFSAGYFSLLYEFAKGHVNVPPQMEDTFKSLIVFLTAQLAIIVAFWFSRQRQSEDPPR